MRSFKDKDGRTAWVFDEKNHPLGYENPKSPYYKGVEEKVIEVKMEEKKFDSNDLNKDGKVSFKEKIISKVKGKK